MSKLNFVFKNAGELLYDERVDYDVVDGYYVFLLDKQTFKLRLDGEFHFIRETEEDIFEITYVEEAKCVYTLKEEKISFDLNISDFECKLVNEKYIIKYNIESDIEEDVSNTKTIIVSFI